MQSLFKVYERRQAMVLLDPPYQKLRLYRWVLFTRKICKRFVIVAYCCFRRKFCVCVCVYVYRDCNLFSNISPFVLMQIVRMASLATLRGNLSNRQCGLLLFNK